jgi:hypothetical protein
MKKEWATPIAAAALGSLISVSAVWAGFWRQVPTRDEVRTMIEDVADKEWFEKLLNNNTNAIVVLTAEVQNLRIAITKLEKDVNSRKQ